MVSTVSVSNGKMSRIEQGENISSISKGMGLLGAPLIVDEKEI